MSKNEATHELLIHRLVDIVRRLNDGETLDPKQLAEMYNTNIRTIQRDLGERLSIALPLIKEQGRYRLDGFYLGKLNLNDIRNFATLVGAADLFPSLDRQFLTRMLDSSISQAYSSKGQFNEDASKFKSLFQKLEPAILQQQKISLYYKGAYHLLEPYKLIHHRGCWYLAAVKEDILKAYRLSFVQEIQVHQEQPSFLPKAEILAQLDKEEGIWFGQDKQEAVLKVDKQVAAHFKQRSLLPHQQVIKELDDGSLIVGCQYVDSVQILSLVRYWLPHLKVVSPESLQRELMQGLKEYFQTE